MIHITNHSSLHHGAIHFYQNGDGRTTLDVRFYERTVWRTQAQMAFLYQTARSAATKHVANIFKSGVSTEAAVWAHFAQTAAGGITHQTNVYTPDVIIAVGYRGNSKRGIRSRIWASSVLKEYLIKGYALNQQRLAERGVAQMRWARDLLATHRCHRFGPDGPASAGCRLRPHAQAGTHPLDRYALRRIHIGQWT